MLPAVQIKGLEAEAERSAEAEQMTLAAIRREAEETQVNEICLAC